jgi:eukaryotic-like serine/threonine-protein kinase
MPLAVGSRLGPYAILAPIGAGGMGEVWQARDTRLDRTVAIKVSCDRFTERFEREARAIAALNHPNVAQIYDVGDTYIVMEYIAGEPMAPLGDLRKVLDAAVQMASRSTTARTGNAPGYPGLDMTRTQPFCVIGHEPSLFVCCH